MTDFLIQIGRRVSSDRVVARLRDRPHLSGRAVRVDRFLWGEVVSQAPPGKGYDALVRDGWLYLSAGRPRLMGVEHETRGPAGFHESLAEALARGSWRSVFERLTGMFVIARVRDDAVEILTDQMGSRPVYRASSAKDGAHVGWSTYLEPLAEVAGRADDLDPVSLAELLVSHAITFPWTSRNGIEELPPATLSTVSMLSDGVAATNEESFWAPSEPSRWRSREQLGEALESAMRFAGEDVARGAASVGTTLSGGWDSRAVLTVIPRGRHIRAITFRSRPNRETETAAKVAAAWGVEHVYADREPEFFATMVERSVRLLGIEVRANGHGLCISDSGAADGLDVVVGGQLSDTYLKDHFMSAETRERVRPKSLRERVRRLLPRAGKYVETPGWARIAAAARSAVRDDVWAGVEERRRRHLERVRAFRPTTADEWKHFWPTSRQHDAGHNLANSRLFSSESLYQHRRILEVAAELPDALRYHGRLAGEVFRKLFGNAMDAIPISNTGVAPAGGEAEEARVIRERRRRGEADAFRRLPQSPTPWLDVQSSWADFGAMQQLSPTWAEYRRNAVRCPRLALLAGITREAPQALLSDYKAAYGEMFNLICMQLAMSIGKDVAATAAAE